MAFLYHEKQKLLLCGVAAVNNLLQEKVYTQQSLDQIADSLPKAGTSLSFGYSSFFGLGNYSADVLIIALQNKGMEVTYFDKRKKAELVHILYDLNIQGLLINQVTYKLKYLKNNHWLAILKMDQEWHNLDGKLKQPDVYHTTKDFIISFLDLLHEESSILIVYNKNSIEKIQQQVIDQQDIKHEQEVKEVQKPSQVTHPLEIEKNECQANEVVQEQQSLNE